MDKLDRIKKLKELTSISDANDIDISDLYLEDEKGQEYIEYIIDKNIYIYNKKLLLEIASDERIIVYMCREDYCLMNSYNADLLFDEFQGKPLIEQMCEKNIRILGDSSLDIKYKLFEKKHNYYMFERLLKKYSFAIFNVIREISDAKMMCDCFIDINRLDLIKYIDKSYWNNDVVKILFAYKKYEEILNMDCSILIKNNYLNLLIEKYKNGENIPFEEIDYKSSDKKSLAMFYLTLLKNNITLNRYELIDNNNSSWFSNYKPVIIHMLEIDPNITQQYFDTQEIKDQFNKYLSLKYHKTIPNNNYSIIDVLKYIPNKEELIATKPSKIFENDIYNEDLTVPLDNGLTVLEYAFKNNIYIYKRNPANVDEVIIFVKYKRKISYLDEKLLYEDIDNNKKIIDLLMEHKNYFCIKHSIKKDLRIMDYCLKYNNFFIISKDIIEELFIEMNGHFKAEKYLNNDSFIKAIQDYNIPNHKKVKLYNNGYKKIIYDVNEEFLLSPYKNATILDDMLNSSIDPVFEKNQINSLETLKILEQHNRYDLFYNADLDLLINYPNKENNYLSKLIDLYKQGINVNLEKRSYKYKDKEIMSRCYIQMAKAGLDFFLDDLTKVDLVKRDDNKNLLYYLIKNDEDITVNKLLKYRVLKQFQTGFELKLLGVNNLLYSLSAIKYDSYEIDEILRQNYNQKYSKNIISPVEDLLNELEELFKNDRKSDMELIKGLIISYRHLTSIDSMFIEELKLLISIKKENPNFCFLRELDRGHFDKERGVIVENCTINSLVHEMGHAFHYYLTDYAVPDNYDEVLEKIKNNPNFIRKINDYANNFQEIKKKVENKAEIIVDRKMKTVEINQEEINDKFIYFKDIVINNYLKKGYTRETLEIVLSETFTVEEFIEQKRKVQIKEVYDLIMRYDYDAFIAVGDIIDAITNGRYKSNILKNENGEIMPPAYGHGIRYYSGKQNSYFYKFTEMVANYSSIIKSKHKDEMLLLLRSIVGDELVDMLDDFYKNKMLKLNTNEKKR